MKNRNVEGAIACVGAVIGAGFASGREIMTFFTRFGVHSWWLILLAACVMIMLCSLTMRAAGSQCTDNWCGIFSGYSKVTRHGSQVCAIALMSITGGAMISASGHMVELLWTFEWSYPIGALGTLCLAWWLGFGSTKSISYISGILTVLFTGAILFVLAQKNDDQWVVQLQSSADLASIALGAVNAIAYAAMNLTIAIGVVCKCANQTSRNVCRLSAIFGFILIGMLFLSNYLYLKHPELQNEVFPIVKLLSQFGIHGFVVSVLLLYLAIFTTLIAIICTLRNAIESYVTPSSTSNIITLLLPIIVSFIGFSDIIDKLYAPIGLCCLIFVFLPIMIKKKRKSS